MFGIIKLTIHTITGMWVSIVLFKLMTNGGDAANLLI